MDSRIWWRYCHKSCWTYLDRISFCGDLSRPDCISPAEDCAIVEAITLWSPDTERVDFCLHDAHAWNISSAYYNSECPINWLVILLLYWSIATMGPRIAQKWWHIWHNSSFRTELCDLTSQGICEERWFLQYFCIQWQSLEVFLKLARESRVPFSCVGCRRQNPKDSWKLHDACNSVLLLRYQKYWDELTITKTFEFRLRYYL